MKVKLSELSGELLRVAVAKAYGVRYDYLVGASMIERHGPPGGLRAVHFDPEEHLAEIMGEAAIDAALRKYVHERLGDEFDL